MNTPTEYFADDVKDWESAQAGVQRKDGTTCWVMARPYGYQGFLLRHRIKLAWMVLTGKADVLKWHG